MKKEWTKPEINEIVINTGKDGQTVEGALYGPVS